MYKLVNDFVVLRTSDSTYIPLDPTNEDYRGYQKWLNKGNTPDAADPLPEATPDLATQLAGALLAKGTLTDQDLNADNSALVASAQGVRA